MLYVDVKKSLDDVIQYLRINSIEVPQDLDKISEAFRRCIETGEQISDENLSLIDRWLFPDTGMGWFEELKYDLSEETYHELNVLTSKLSRIMRET